MAIDREDADQLIHTLTYSGFYAPDEIKEIIAEEFLDPDQLDDADIRWIDVATDAKVSEKLRAEDSWPEATDWDRLDDVFEDLDEALILSLHNAGGTVSDGFEDAGEIIQDLAEDGIEVRGTVFYHGQDTERAVHGEPLFLAFGSVLKTPEADKAIAQEVVDKLKAAGFDARWPGDPEHRIEIHGFDWKKRGLGDDDEDDDEDDDDRDDEDDADDDADNPSS